MPAMLFSGLHLTLKRMSELISAAAPLVTRWLLKTSSTLTKQSSLETDRSYELGLAAYHPRQEVTVATAQATQRKVGRKRKHNPNLPIQERLLPNLDCQAIAAGAKLCADRTAVLTARPPADRCVPVRAREPRLQGCLRGLLLRCSPNEPNFDFSVGLSWLRRLSPRRRWQPLPLRQSRIWAVHSRVSPWNLSREGGGEQLPAAGSICCAFFLRHNKSQIN